MQRQFILAAAIAIQISCVHAGTTDDLGATDCKQFAEPRLCIRLGEDPSRQVELPRLVAAYVKDIVETCTAVGGKPVAGPKIEHDRLVSGPEFWSVSDATLTCEGALSIFSGPHGSDVAAFVALPDGNLKRFTIQGTFGMRTEDVANSSKLWLAVSGANCGQKGDVATALQIACERDLVWDRTTQKLDFAPLSRAIFASRAVSPKPAPRDPPRFYQPAVHNGSEMRVNEWDDGRIEIVYVAPRPDLHVAEGTVLFRGTAKGRRYAGTAYTFKPGCEPAPYPVSGARDDKRDIIVLTGPAPGRIPNSCELTFGSMQSKNARLVFDVRIDGDE